MGKKRGRSLNHKIEAALKKRLSRLVKEYDPQPVMDIIDIWTQGFRTYLLESGVKQNMSVEEAIKLLDEYFYWIESLIKTWRDEVGSTNK